MTQPHSQVIFNNGSHDLEPPVESWSVSRSLSSWGLPGQAKIPTGVGTGQGSATVLDTLASTWALGTHVAPGNKVGVQAIPNAPGTASSVLQGVVREVSADGSDPLIRSASIEDDMAALGRIPRVREAFASGPAGAHFDAAYVVDQCARTAGYRSTPAIDNYTRLSVPLAGSIAPERGTQVNGFTGAAEWTTVDGQIVPANLPPTVYELNAEIPISDAVRIRARGRHNSTAAFSVRVHSSLGLSYTTINFRHSGIAWEWQREGSGVWSTASLDYVFRCEWEITWVSNTQVSVRYRTVNGNPGVWQSAGTQSGPSFSGAWWREVSISGEISEVQMSREATQLPPLDDPTAVIAATGIKMQAIVIQPGRSCWEIAQEVARACSAALWIDEDGRLRFMPLSEFVGRPPSHTLQVQSDLASRPWAISRDDYADRLEVTYTALSVATASDYSLPVWESTDVVMVPANGSVTIRESMSVAVQYLGAFSSPGGTTMPASGSIWAAYTAAKHGTRQTAGITVTAALDTPHRIAITITNSNAFPVWMVDYEGNPVIIARANKTASAGEQGSVEFGASDENALVPATIDLGSFVQIEPTAQAIGSDLWDRLQSPELFIRSVEVWPSPLNRLGAVVTLDDPPGGLPPTKAVITNISNSGSDGVWQQTLDLAIIGPA